MCVCLSVCLSVCVSVSMYMTMSMFMFMSIRWLFLQFPSFCFSCSANKTCYLTQSVNLSSFKKGKRQTYEFWDFCHKMILKMTVGEGKKRKPVHPDWILPQLWLIVARSCKFYELSWLLRWTIRICIFFPVVCPDKWQHNLANIANI